VLVGIREVLVAKRKNLIDVVSEKLILIPEGLYKARFIDHDCGVMFARQAKLMALFEITEGDYQGVMLSRYYNIKPSRGSVTKQKWKVGRSSDLLRELCDCTLKSYRRLDQLPLTDWRESCQVVQVKVKTVKTSANQQAIPEPIQYSVIERVSRIPKKSSYALVDNVNFINAALRSYANRE